MQSQPQFSLIISHPLSTPLEALQKSLTLIADQWPPHFELILSLSASMNQPLDLPIKPLISITQNPSPQNLRNQGALAASGAFFLFLDSQLLLNPQSLKAYQNHFQQGHALIYSYFGNQPNAGPSQLLSKSMTYSQDVRWHWASSKRLLPQTPLKTFPHWFAWAAHFACTRALWNTLGPFNPSLSTLMAELEWAQRAQETHTPIAFALDTWAEAQESPASFEAELKDFELQLKEDATKTAPQILGWEAPDLLPVQPTDHPASTHPPPNKSLLEYARRIHYFGVKRPAKCLPDFLIIGAQKAGTTSLTHYLLQHPAIAPPYVKEVNFFNRSHHFQDKAQFCKDFEYYRQAFYYAPNTLRFEATPEYLSHPKAPARIAQCLPQIRLIAILRDPIERAFSDWNMLYHWYQSQAQPANIYDFETLIAKELAGEPGYGCLERGLYAVQLQRYLKYFSRKQILILDFDMLISQPQTLMQTICQFLNISAPPPTLDYTAQHMGAYNHMMSETTRQKLLEYYHQPNQALKQMGLQFTWLEKNS